MNRSVALLVSLALSSPALTPLSAAANPPDGVPVGDPHPSAINTGWCSFHGTSSPYDATYATFETSLIGPRGNTGRPIQAQVELHQVGGASVVIIEDGAITQHHWYGCRDRKGGARTTASTIYQAASLSKFVSSVGFAHAERHGDIDIDQDVDSLTDEFPDSLLAEWAHDNFDNDTEAYLGDINVRRLLNHSAGLDTDSIGAWDPADVPTMREVILGSDEFGNYFVGGVEPIFAPKMSYEYSGGGYIVAEHLLELQTPSSFKDYLQAHVLDLADMTLSTFEKASTSMTNLVRGCSRTSCSYGLQQTNVKAAGGLLANAREYAELVTALVNGGTTDGGNTVMEQADIDLILKPAAHTWSTFDACSSPGATRALYHDIEGAQMFVGFETCVAGQWRMMLLDDGSWYGLGVALTTTVLSDGFPRTVSHSGAQTGSRTYFKIDRLTGDGVVIMINGEDQWVDGDGYAYGSDPLLWEIVDAYNAAY